MFEEGNEEEGIFKEGILEEGIFKEGFDVLPRNDSVLPRRKLLLFDAPPA